MLSNIRRPAKFKGRTCAHARPTVNICQSNPGTRGHTPAAGNISNPNPRTWTTCSQYIYIQPAGTHDPQSIYLTSTRAHARPAVNTYTFNPRAYTTRSQYIY